jgi:hypothetical protein
MSAITARKDVQRQQGEILPYPVEEATKIFEGALVSVNAAGYAVNATDAANDIFVGVADITVDNTAGADGAETVHVRTSGVIDVVTSGLSQANVGDKVYVVDNQTVALAATTTNDVLVGKIVKFISATKVRVAITPFA